ncbi:MAG TPA: hypothetical protein VHI10_08500 [Mycobacterium sp.]|nr:hypothetical protein [Mycobacterium sp.]
MQARAHDLHLSPVDVAGEMNTCGVACLRSVVSEDWLAAARELVTAYLPANGEHERFSENPDGVIATFVERLVTEAGLKQLMRSLAAADCPSLRLDDRVGSALRVLTGPGPDKPLWFHYDETVVSVVVPIVIPHGLPGFSGELVLSPNRRSYRRFAVANIVEKLIVQNNIYRRWYTRNLGEDRRVIPLEPGNAYVFWGYRTFHATLPCPPDSLRVTLMLHYGALHSGSRALAAAKSFRRWLREWRD